MQREFVQSKNAIYIYLAFVTGYPAFLIIMILLSPLISIALTFFLLIFTIFSIPNILLAILSSVPHFFKKINLQEKILLHESNLEIVSGTKNTKINFSNINSMVSLSYGTYFNSGIIYEISDGKNKYHIPPTYLNRNELLKEIIIRANLKANPTTLSSTIQAQFIWNRSKGFFRTWSKSTSNISKEDLKLDSFLVNQGKIAIIFYVFFILIILCNGLYHAYLNM